MPTQIPAKTRLERAGWSSASSSRHATREGSLLNEAIVILMHMLLAAAIIYGVAFVVIWAYT